MTALSLIREHFASDATHESELREIMDDMARVYDLPLLLEAHCGHYATDADILRWHTVAHVESWLALHEREAA